MNMSTKMSRTLRKIGEELSGKNPPPGSSEFRANGLYDAWFAGLCLGMETGKGRVDADELPGRLADFSMRSAFGGDPGKVFGDHGVFLSMKSATDAERCAYAAGMGTGIGSSTAGKGAARIVALEIARRAAPIVGVDFHTVKERSRAPECDAYENAFTEMKRSFRSKGRTPSAAAGATNLAAATIAIIGMFSIMWSSPGTMKASESEVASAFSDDGEKIVLDDVFSGAAFETKTFVSTMKNVLGSGWRNILERDECFQASLSRVGTVVEPAARRDVIAELVKELDDAYKKISEKEGDLHPLNYQERKSLSKVASLRAYLSGDPMEALAFEVAADPGNPSLLTWLSDRGINPFELVDTYIDGFSPEKNGKEPYGPVAEFITKVYGSFNLGKEAVFAILHAETSGGRLDVAEAAALNSVFADSGGR